jgi:adenylate kinase family enzyme
MTEHELSQPLGRRIAIYGAGGKSTLAASIARKRSLELIGTDGIHHMPNWQPRPFEQTRDIVLAKIAAAKDGWVIEGNYAELRPYVLPQVETAIVIQLPFRVVFWRILKRSVPRAAKRKVIHGGNRESFRLTFCSRYSILLEIWQKRKRFATMGETIAAEKPASTRLIVLRSTRELNKFNRAQGLSREEEVIVKALP